MLSLRRLCNLKSFESAGTAMQDQGQGRRADRDLCAQAHMCSATQRYRFGTIIMLGSAAARSHQSSAPVSPYAEPIESCCGPTEEIGLLQTTEALCQQLA